VGSLMQELSRQVTFWISRKTLPFTPYPGRIGAITANPRPSHQLATSAVMGSCRSPGGVTLPCENMTVGNAATPGVIGL
jgi:hypothetical protein